MALGAPEALGEEGRPSSPPTNLPAQLTPLVGRNDILGALTTLLKSDDVRLVTLTGPPGIGKTRLAVQVAHSILPDLSDGVFFVPLAPLRDPAFVMNRVAGALNLREKGTEPISLTLREHLREQQVLLVLDNFEQVIAAASAILELLWSCPRLKMLVTSREALHVRGERRYVVPTLTHEASVQLFLERAREVENAFSLTPAQAVSVGTLCACMEGVLLAIELVAARVRLMSPQAILARLDSHRSDEAGGGVLPLLVGGPRDLPERHRTLRSAIGRSYDLMSPAEQGLYKTAVLFGALAALLEKRSGALLLLVDVPAYERVLADVRGTLDDSSFSRAWQEGRALSVDQLVDGLGEAAQRHEGR